jgi:hypothetical protein
MVKNPLDYSATEAQLTPDIRALEIYTNNPEGLLTVSRFAAALFGGGNDTSKLFELVTAALEIETSTTTAIDLLDLAQVLERVESFAHASGGLVIAALSGDAPDELATSLQKYAITKSTSSEEEHTGFYL